MISCRTFLIQNIESINRYTREKENRYNFIEVKDPSRKLLPDNDRKAAYNHSTEFSVSGCISPEKRITGPKAAPNPAQAYETRPITELFGPLAIR